MINSKMIFFFLQLRKQKCKKITYANLIHKKHLLPYYKVYRVMAFLCIRSLITNI